MDSCRTAVGYGAILSYYSPQEGRLNLAQATRDLIQRLRAQNPSMQVTGNSRKANVDGSQALITMLESSSPFGGTETDVLVTVARPEGLFYMVFIAPQRALQPATKRFPANGQIDSFSGLIICTLEAGFRSAGYASRC